MKQYLLPSVLILVAALASALAQNINKSIQLSQDPTGSIGFDTGNNAYWPGHMLSTGPGVPALTSCGTTPAIVGTDTAGEVTMGTTATGCIITFNKAYLATPWCVLNWQATPLATQFWTVSLTAITTTQTSTSNNKLNYICMGSK